jgi:hypothetical protein
MENMTDTTAMSVVLPAFNTSSVVDSRARARTGLSHGDARGRKDDSDIKGLREGLDSMGGNKVQAVTTDCVGDIGQSSEGRDFLGDMEAKISKETLEVRDDDVMAVSARTRVARACKDMTAEAIDRRSTGTRSPHQRN